VCFLYVDMTPKKQSEVLRMFENGTCKVLVCTRDAAGEGMDVADCNYVITYDYMKSEISRVQIKGQSRFKNKKLVYGLAAWN